MYYEVRMLDLLVPEKKKPDCKQAGARGQNDENENDRTTDVLLLRPRAQLVQRRRTRRASLTLGRDRPLIPLATIAA